MRQDLIDRVKNGAAIENNGTLEQLNKVLQVFGKSVSLGMWRFYFLENGRLSSSDWFKGETIPVTSFFEDEFQDTTIDRIQRLIDEYKHARKLQPKQITREEAEKLISEIKGEKYKIL